MSKVNEYAKELLNKKPKGRPVGWSRSGSVIAGKKLTPWEEAVVSSSLTYNKKMYGILFAKPLNKWYEIK